VVGLGSAVRGRKQSTDGQTVEPFLALRSRDRYKHLSSNSTDSECENLIPVSHNVRMSIDYSRWDNLECSDSDDGEFASTPRVTCLQEPSRVTFGGGSGDCGVAIQGPPSPPAVGDDDRVGSASSTDHSAATALSFQNSNQNNLLNSWTCRGGCLETADRRRLYWCQDRYSVQLRMELKDKEKIDRINVDGILPYADRHCATGTIKNIIRIWGRHAVDADGNNQHAVPLLQGNLPHPIHWSQQDDDSDLNNLDWSVERHPLESIRRFVSITMYKAVPMHGIFVWWKRPLLQFEEIALDDEQGAARSEASKEFSKCWDEAHRKFRENKQLERQSRPS
jgi:hypothetical protein